MAKRRARPAADPPADPPRTAEESAGPPGPSRETRRPLSREFLDMSDVMLYFDGRISRRTLYRLVEEGELAHYRIGRKILVRREDLAAFIEGVRTPEPVQEGPPPEEELAKAAQKDRAAAAGGGARLRPFRFFPTTGSG